MPEVKLEPTAEQRAAMGELMGMIATEVDAAIAAARRNEREQCQADIRKRWATLRESEAWDFYRTQALEALDAIAEEAGKGAR